MAEGFKDKLDSCFEVFIKARGKDNEGKIKCENTRICHDNMYTLKVVDGDIFFTFADGYIVEMDKSLDPCFLNS